VPAFFSHSYPPLGVCVQLPGGPNLHIYSQGPRTGASVVFEAGIAGSCLSWSLVQPLVAEFAHTVSYDRAGLGWSSGPLTPRTITNMVAELAATLEAAQVRPPYTLVGHSFGCLLIQAFAYTHPSQTAALVMLDPVTQTGWANPDAQQLRRLSAGARLSRRGAWLARLGIVRAALALLIAGGTILPKLVAHASAGQGESVIERLIGEVRKLPPETQAMVAAHWSRARSFTAMAAYLECLPPSARQALKMPSPPEIPLTVLSAASATSAELAERAVWVAANRNARHLQVAGTGHWLQLERPALVASIIREAVLGVR
jgi:pimeloyl-ACP methyl ester carboxylesterase